MKLHTKHAHATSGMLSAIVTLVMTAAVNLAFAGNIWYVAPAPIGDDSYDGTASNHVSGTVGPRRTLAKVMELAKSWDVVYALPGTYDDGSYYQSDSYYARVYVPSAVRLISVAGPEKTFIVGKAADAGQGDAYGNGPGALRGVLLAGTIDGFTICGGHVRSTADDATGRGGGIFADWEGALAINCIISNNVAVRGVGMCGKNSKTAGTDNRFTRAVNCRFIANTSTSKPGSGSFYVDTWNCVYRDNSGGGGVAFGNATARNCTILDGHTGAILFNSILAGTDSGSCFYTNTITTSLHNTSVLGEGSTRTSTRGEIYADFRPSKLNNVGIDNGVYLYYTNSFPSGTLGATHFIDKDIRGFPRVTGESIDIGAGEYAPLDLYVDAVNGDDGNDALAPGVGHARRTMAGVFGIVNGDIVHAAPGIYSEGLMGLSGDSTTNRVIVPVGAGLVADEGPAVTIIEGAAATTSDLKNNCGSNAVRCVRLCSSAWIKGFTLRNGATAIPANNLYTDCGGGVYGNEDSFTIGCRFTNCSARRGGGAYGGYYFGCLFDSSLMSAGMAQTSGGYNAEGYYGCVFDGSSLYGTIRKVVNCSFFGGSLGGNPASVASKPLHVYNSYVATDGGSCNFHRCVVGTVSGTGSTSADDTRFSQTANITYDSETYRPLVSSFLRDYGNSIHWKTNFPDSFPGNLAGIYGVDYAGGQRIYNGNIDVGAGEYDCLGDFAGVLRPRGGVSVTDASEGVELASDGLSLSDGDTFSAVWTLPKAGRLSIDTSLSGGGTLVLKLDGNTVEPDANGICMMRAPAGEHLLQFAYTGPGAAWTGHFAIAKGVCVSFK